MHYAKMLKRSVYFFVVMFRGIFLSRKRLQKPRDIFYISPIKSNNLILSACFYHELVKPDSGQVSFILGRNGIILFHIS